MRQDVGPAADGMPQTAGRGDPSGTPGDRVSGVAAADGQLDPAAVLAAAMDRLTADGHADLAAAVQRVDEYLRDLAAAHTEITLANDRLLERGEALLSTAPTDLPSAPGQRPADPDLRAG